MQYMVRIEIHHADGETYERLHATAVGEGLSRMLTAERDDRQYHMPIGAYWIDTNESAWAVLERAKRAALPINRNAEIVVSGGPQLVFYGCRPVISAPAPRLGSLSVAAALSGRVIPPLQSPFSTSRMLTVADLIGRK